MNRKVFLYVKALSDFGMFMDLIVLNVLVYAATGSATWLAATMAARTIGGVVSSLYSGVLADRFNRRKIMIITDILRGAIILILIPFPDPIMILVVSFLIGFVNSTFMISFSSEIPQIFGEDKVLETNALISRLTSISLVVGFLAAGIITEFLGYKITLLIDALTYFLSAIVLLKLKWDSPKSRIIQVGNKFLEKIKSVWIDLREVYAYLIVAPMLMFVNIVFLVGAFAGSSYNLGIPLLAESIDVDRQSFYYGLIWGVWGIGSVLATYTLPKLSWLRNERVYYTSFVSAMLMSLGFIIFLSTTNIYIIFVFVLLTGVFDACFTTLHATILQRTDNHIRGRIFGVGMLLKSLGFACGFILAPNLLHHLSMPQMVMLLHGTLIAVTCVVIILAMYSKGKIANKQTKNAG